MSISQSKEVWIFIENLKGQLTNTNLFPKGNLVLLKSCNFLLRKLSKSLDTEVSRYMYLMLQFICFDNNDEFSFVVVF
jgi:hypothetical protein